MLGVLSAVNAALRPLGAGTAGIETVFFVLVLAGRVYGPGCGFTLGCTSFFISALITGGVGLWMPYQMFGCGFVGMLACLLPRANGRREVLMLATYGSVSGYLFGFLLNLSFWPFSLDPNSSLAYVPGLPFTEQWHRYLVFDLATSLGWDTGRAVTNFVCILLAGPAVLTNFRRAAPASVHGSGSHRQAPLRMTCLDGPAPAPAAPGWLAVGTGAIWTSWPDGGPRQLADRPKPPPVARAPEHICWGREPRFSRDARLTLQAHRSPSAEPQMALDLRLREGCPRMTSFR
ncbi:hypothetical protein EES39_22140 [Streptomyces sp. ADI92-24]|nr:hypothetical protein EES39_22140 [Streptomyces sp. ADI92-24]